jgi:G3E family GTPase
VKGQIKDVLYQKTIVPTELVTSQKNLELNTVEKVFTMKILLTHNTKWSSLVIWLSALLYCHGRRILRVKGVVSSPAGPLLLQGVGEYIQKPHILPKSFESQEKYLILILRDMNRDEILRSIKFVYNE